MIVGYWSPLPPQPTGVADYAAALLEVLRRFGCVRPRARRADVFLYQLGNNQLHREIYFQALEQPGVVVLHDAVLHHFFLGALDRAGYIEEFVYNYGEWMRGLAEELWGGRSRSAQDPLYFQFPMLRRIAEVSRAVVVHNPAAARMVLEHAPGARVVEIPFPCWRTEAPWAAAWRWRQRVGLPAGTVLFGVFGYLREAKRVGNVLRAFQEVRRGGAPAALVLAGRFATAEFERAMAPWMEGVIRAPHLPEREFWTLAAAADVCVNLRHPAAGESSGVGVNMMGLGKTVMLTANQENARFPELACLRVRPGLSERAEIAEFMRWLARARDAVREIGRRAAEYVRQHHTLEGVAARYWEVLAASRL